MTVIEVRPGTPEYERSIDLRNEVLRIPLGQRITDDERETDLVARHFALVEDGVTIACAQLQPRPSGWQVRQVAVRADRQGEGLGARIMAAVEAAAGPGELFLHARKPVIAFYERIGWTAVGDEFVEVGIPHRRMVKTLRADECGNPGR